MREVELEQPIFGANYIKGRILAEQFGNSSKCLSIRIICQLMGTNNHLHFCVCRKLGRGSQV